jgi:hypothetical protein
MFAATNTAIQLNSPSGLLGRMLGLYQLSVIGPIAVGSLVAGGIAEAVGIGWSLGLFGLVLGAWGLWSLTHRVPTIDDPPPLADPRLAGGLREGISGRGARAAAARRR